MNIRTEKVLDIARYRCSDPARLQELHPGMVRAVREAWPGLLHAELALLPDGSFLDIVAWDSPASAQAGLNGERDLPEYAAFAAQITEVLFSACVPATSK